MNSSNGARLRLGAVFPTTEIGEDVVAIRDWVQAAEDLGYDHLVVFDHVLGAERRGREALLEHLPYDHSTPFHEPMVLLGYLAALTRRILLATGVLVSTQRPTALVAKQAAELDLLSDGRLVLGLGAGASPIEHEGLGYAYESRFKRFEEQVPLLRRLWREEAVDFAGAFDRIDRAGLLPRPRRAIPIWFGGRSEPMYRRAARLADGFIFGTDGAASHAGARRIGELLSAAGRDPAGFPLDMITAYSWGAEHWAREAEAWTGLGGTHLTLRTTDASAGIHHYPPNRFSRAQQHIDALQRFMAEMR